MNYTTSENKTIALLGTEGSEQEDFMEEVETYMTYKVASAINQYWFPVLVPIGLIGNTLSFLVMIKPNNRKVSTCIYMAGISVNDNLTMSVSFYYWLVMVVKIYGLTLWECKIATYFVNIFLKCSTYQVLAMTFDKYFAIKWPHRAATYSIPRRTKIILLCIYLCAFIYNVPHLLITSLVGDFCFSYVVGGLVAEVFSWTTFLVNGIIPFSLLIHMNFVIVQTVRRSQKMFGSITNIATIESVSDGNIGTIKRQRTMKSAENQLTVMLLLVTMLFLILLLPTYIRFIYSSLLEMDTPSKYAGSMLFSQVTHKLYITKNGINFFLYCISGKKFRNDLKEILHCVDKSSERSRNTVQSNSSLTTQN